MDIILASSNLDQVLLFSSLTYWYQGSRAWSQITLPSPLFYQVANILGSVGYNYYLTLHLQSEVVTGNI